MQQELTPSEMGRRGGRSTVDKYGNDYMRDLSRRGAEAFKDRMQDPSFREAHARASRQQRGKA